MRLKPISGDHHRPCVGGIMTDYQKEVINHLRLPAPRTSQTRSPGGREAEGIDRFTPLVANHRSTDAGSVVASQKICLSTRSAILRTFIRQALQLSGGLIERDSWSGDFTQGQFDADRDPAHILTAYLGGSLQSGKTQFLPEKKQGCRKVGLDSQPGGCDPSQ
jgi:hypothetical protein